MAPYSTGAECHMVNVEKVQPGFFCFSQIGYRRCSGSAMTFRFNRRSGSPHFLALLSKKHR